jgi:hypothetical protein
MVVVISGIIRSGWRGCGSGVDDWWMAEVVELTGRRAGASTVTHDV